MALRRSDLEAARRVSGYFQLQWEARGTGKSVERTVSAGGPEEVSFGAFESPAIEGDVDPLVVEGDEAGDG
jgi:hypothetical protein